MRSAERYCQSKLGCSFWQARKQCGLNGPLHGTVAQAQVSIFCHRLSLPNPRYAQ